MTDEQEKRSVRYQCLVCLRTEYSGRDAPKGWIIPAGASLPGAIDPEVLECTVRGYCSPSCEVSDYPVR